MIKIEVEGYSYPSLKQACRAYGIHYNTVYSRLQRGMSLKSALLSPDRNHIATKDHLGNLYPSIKDLCKAYGMHPVTFIRRLNQGWSIKRTLTTPVDISKRTFKCRELYEKEADYS